MRKIVAIVLAGAAFAALTPCLKAQQGPVTGGMRSVPHPNGMGNSSRGRM